MGHNVVNGPISVSVYAGTKHAITGMTKALRFDAQKMVGFKMRVSVGCM